MFEEMETNVMSCRFTLPSAGSIQLSKGLRYQQQTDKSVIDSIQTRDIPLSTNEAISTPLCMAKKSTSLWHPASTQLIVVVVPYQLALVLEYTSSICANQNLANVTTSFTGTFFEVAKLKDNEFQSFPCQPKQQSLNLLSWCVAFADRREAMA